MKFTNSLAPVAVLVLVSASAMTVFGYMVIVVPVIFYWQLSMPVLSDALPIVGVILFATILLGISGKRTEEVKPTVIENFSNQKVMVEGKKEDERQKAA